MSSDQISDALPKLDWRSPEYEQAPLPYLKELAQSCPVARTEFGYAVLAREEARPVLRADLPISVYHIPEAISPYLAERTKQPLLTRHGPEHTELRSMLTRVLRTRVIEALRPQIRSIFINLLEPLLARGEGDLVADLFHPYPAQVLAPMLGIPMADIDQVSAWVTSSARWTNMLNPPETLATIETAWRALESYLLKLLEERRQAPGTDVFSELIREMDGHDELEIVGIAMELTRAGMDTTRRQLACTMYALIEHPEEWQRTIANPELVSRVVEEGMRYASITHALSRQTLTDTEMAGQQAPAGTVFTVMPMVANRVPAFDLRLRLARLRGIGAGADGNDRGVRPARGTPVESFELIGEVPRSHVSTGWVPQKLPVRLRGRV